MSAPSAVIDRARQTQTGLASRNPTVKLCLLFVVSLALTFVLDPVTPLILYLLVMAALIVSRSVALSTLLLWQLPFLGFAIGVFLVNVLSRPGAVIWQEGLLRITAEGVTVGAALFLRTMLTGVLAISFIISTEPAKLMTSLHLHARLSIRVCSAILGGYRILQTLPHEWQTIRDAHLVRAELGRRGTPTLGMRGHSRVAFALLVSALRQGERIAQTFEHRGLGLTPRTTWKPVALDARDGAFAVIVVVAFGVVLACSAMLGLLQGPGQLFV